MRIYPHDLDHDSWGTQPNQNVNYVHWGIVG